MVDERELEGRKAQALCHITPGQTPAIAEGPTGNSQGQHSHRASSCHRLFDHTTIAHLSLLHTMVTLADYERLVTAN